MTYRVFKTGIPELDSMLGGGIIQDGVLLLIYGTGSYGWALGVEVFRRFLERDWFGVVTDYSFPFGLLCKYAYAVRFDIPSLGRSNRLAVIDIFDSVNGVPVNEDFVYSVGSVDGSTFLPKILALYRNLIAGKKKRIGISITLDGFVGIFGEETGMKILQRNMALKESAPRDSGEDILNVFLLNRDRVSSRFLAWISQYAEHIVEFQSLGRPGIERMLVRKSLLPEFEPVEALFRFRKERIEIVPGANP